MKTNQVTRNNITFHLEEDSRAYQTINGDWSVEPGTKVLNVTCDLPDTRMGGSVLNPQAGSKSQGWAKMGWPPSDILYDDSLTVNFPVTLAPGDSLVSAVNHNLNYQSPQLQYAAVLSCYDSAPTPWDFRDHYCKQDGGREKKIRHSLFDLRHEKIVSVPNQDGPNIHGLIKDLDNIWLDTHPGWAQRFLHPKHNMPNYGADMANVVGQASIAVHCDYPFYNKVALLVRLIQLGIDLYGIAKNGGKGNWYADGGVASGRKWPILFASIMLDDPEMAELSGVSFGEDQQTYYKSNGAPWWGIRHSYKPELDTDEWTAKYRRCCTANSWAGYQLIALGMGAKSLWGHDAFFDWVDFYIATQRARNDPGWMTSKSPWVLKMYDTYRPLIP